MIVLLDSGVWFTLVELVRVSRTGSEVGERRTDSAEAAGIGDTAVTAVLVVEEKAEAALGEVFEVKDEAAGAADELHIEEAFRVVDVHTEAAVDMAMVVTAAAAVRFGKDVVGVDKEDW